MGERVTVLLLPAALAAIAVVEVVVLGDSRTSVAAAVVAPLVVAPLGLRARAPFAALGLMQILFLIAVAAGLSLLVEVGALFAAVLFGVYSMSASVEWGKAALGWFAAAVALAVTVVLAGDDDGFAFVGGLMLLVPAVAGQAVRRQRRQAEQLRDLAERLDREQEDNARLAVLAERNRIARELHDVLAHSLSVMVVQADGGRHQIGVDPEAERRAFESIEATGRDALAESRRLLGVLREAPDASPLDPQPGLKNLDALVERTRASGLATELLIEGDQRPLSAGLDLAAYRIVQEALTNTVRHSGASSARVRVSFHADAVELDLSDDGPDANGDRRSAIRGGGHGIVGMRERAALYGGELEAGPAPTGGFRVRARLPIER
jgi:signal transduction histidine kinase